MNKLGKKVLYSVTILGMLIMLTISGGILVGSTPKLVQNQDANPIILYTAAENNIIKWNTTWGGTNYDEGINVAVDTSGIIYCIGNTNSFGVGNYDMALVKFTPTGTKLWNVTWGGTNVDYGYGVAVDASGAIYCVGETNSFGAGLFDLALVKFAPNGTRLWNITWGGYSNERSIGVAVDAAGNLYCVGSTGSFGVGNGDLALVKVAPNGTRLWNITWGGVDVEEGTGVAMDAAGNLYCVGSTGSFGAGNYDFALVKVAPNGTRLWNITWGGKLEDRGINVAVDSIGNIYCIGWTLNFGAGNYDFALVKVAPNGTRLWNTTWGGVGSDLGVGVVVDASGAIYCSGNTRSFGAGDVDFALVKFTPTGTKLWNTTWGSTYKDQGLRLAMDADGSLYCVGYINYGVAGSYDFVLVKFGYLSGPGGIPGFELVYLLIGLLAFIPLVQRRRSSRTLS